MTEGLIKSSCEEADDGNKLQVNFESSHENNKNISKESQSSKTRILLERENGDVLSISFDNSKEIRKKPG